MKRRIVFATGNENKMKEIRMILSDLNTEIVSMKEAGVDIDIVEVGMSPEYGCTTAQLSPEQKNEVSHRGKALCAIKRKLKGKIGDDLL